MVASIGKIAAPSQGVGYSEKDGYYAKEDAAHKEASAWAGKGAEALGLSGPVDPEAFRRAGAGAWATPSSQVRQAYFGRTVTITRSCAGTISSLSLRSSPIRTISPQPQGQSVLFGSITCSIRGRCAGKWPRLRARTLRRRRRVFRRPRSLHLRALKILERQLAFVRRQFLRPLAVNDALKLTHQIFQTAISLHLGLAHQRLVLGAKRLQRRKRLPRCLFGRQCSEVDLCKGQHGPLVAQCRGGHRSTD